MSGGWWPSCRRTSARRLMLVAVDGMGYADAAGVLGVPMGTVASRVARARLALAVAMEGKEVASPVSQPALARSGS